MHPSESFALVSQSVVTVRATPAGFLSMRACHVRACPCAYVAMLRCPQLGLCVCVHVCVCVYVAMLLSQRCHGQQIPPHGTTPTEHGGHRLQHNLMRLAGPSGKSCWSSSKRERLYFIAAATRGPIIDAAIGDPIALPVAFLPSVSENLLENIAGWPCNKKRSGFVSKRWNAR